MSVRPSLNPAHLHYYEFINVGRAGSFQMKLLALGCEIIIELRRSHAICSICRELHCREDEQAPTGWCRDPTRPLAMELHQHLLTSYADTETYHLDSSMNGRSPAACQACPWTHLRAPIDNIKQWAWDVAIDRQSCEWLQSQEEKIHPV